MLRLSATAVAERTPDAGFHLWVLEQNGRAQAFYHALGGRPVERAPVPPPGGDPAGLNSSPSCLRYAWPRPPTALDDGVRGTGKQLHKP
jgi:hypothetical protein